jgi:hypothetical protein
MKGQQMKTYTLTIHEKSRDVIHKNRTAQECAEIMREAQAKGFSWTFKKGK